MEHVIHEIFYTIIQESNYMILTVIVNGAMQDVGDEESGLLSFGARWAVRGVGVADLLVVSVRTLFGL